MEVQGFAALMDGGFLNNSISGPDPSLIRTTFPVNPLIKSCFFLPFSPSRLGNLLPVGFDNESFGCLSSHPSPAFRTTMIRKDNVYERKFVKLLPYSSRNTASGIVKVWAFSVDLAQEGGGTSTFSKQHMRQKDSFLLT